jgi:hypothetical protein
MDIDAQEKHVRSLLAFKAWAEPILLALQESAALAAIEADPAIDPQIVEPAVGEQTNVSQEQPLEPVASEAHDAAPVEKPTEAVAVEGEVADAPQPDNEAAAPVVETETAESVPMDANVSEQPAAPAAI